MRVRTGIRIIGSHHVAIDVVFACHAVLGISYMTSLFWPKFEKPEPGVDRKVRNTF